MVEQGAVVGAFDRAAPTYDRVGVPFFQPIAQALVDVLQVQPGERALDLGCGRGAALFALADRVGVHGHVLGVDLSPRMVELTAAEAAGRPNIEVQVADAAAPQLRAASYDVVAASMVLFFLPDPRAAVRAWVELLAPGGRLGLTTMGDIDPQWQQLCEPLAPYLTSHQDDGPADSSLVNGCTDLEALLTDLGLHDAHTEHATVEAAVRDAAHVEAFMRSTVQRLLWEAVPDSDLPEVRRSLAAAVRRLASDDGTLRIRQLVHHTVARR